MFHALRREELCKLRIKDFRHTRKGVPHLKVSGKGGKTRHLPLHPGTHALIHEYIKAAGQGADDAGALFRPIRNNATGALDKAITPDGVLQAGAHIFGRARIQDPRARAEGDGGHQCARSRGRYRQGAGVAWPRDIATTRIYDHRRTRRTVRRSRSITETWGCSAVLRLAAAWLIVSTLGLGVDLF
jgi:integrase/recombinase XerD